MPESCYAADELGPQTLFQPWMAPTIPTDWQAAFDSVPYPLVLLDADSRVVRANRAGASMLSGTDATVGLGGCLFGSQNRLADHRLIQAAFESKQTEATEIFDEE